MERTGRLISSDGSRHLLLGYRTRRGADVSRLYRRSDRAG